MKQKLAIMLLTACMALACTCGFTACNGNGDTPHEHTYVHGVCTECGELEPQPTDGLIFTLSVDEMEYAVTGYTGTETEVTITPTYKGLTVTSIESNAFQNSEHVTSITIPDSVISIGKNAFNGTAYYNDERNWDNDALYIGNHLIKARETLSGTYTIRNGTKVIAASVFQACENLAGITIPGGVTHIGNWAFSGCSNLTSITIPDSVISSGVGVLDDTAYYNDESNWENDVLYLSNHLIEARSTLSGAYAIRNSTRTIADNAFQFCQSITDITIPDSITRIGDFVFQNCRSLSSITIPDSVVSLGVQAFEYCSSLTSITIPGSVTSIRGWAFAWCTSLTTISIPDSVTSIAYGAFTSCFNLTSITIPNSVTIIGRAAFSGCISIESITVASGNPVYHSVDNCLIETANKTLVLGCKNSVIPTDGSVISIGDEAFYWCKSLTSVTIPESVTSIGRGAFTNCDNLTSVTFENTEGWSVEGWDGQINNIDVTDPAQNVVYLTDTYRLNVWTRGE